MIHIHHREVDRVWYAVAVDDEKVYATSFSFDEADVLKSLLESLPYGMPFQLAEGTSQLSRRLMGTLKAIYDGKHIPLNFKLALDHLSDYSRKVLGCVFLVPVGYVTTYGAVAEAVGGSPRAVGRVMATNPFPPLVPCHRVVRADMSVGGYGLGRDVKWDILQREERGCGDAKTMRVGDKNLVLYPVKFLQKG